MKNSLHHAIAFILLAVTIVSPSSSFARQTIAIIGGGASGIFTAYFLNQKYPGRYNLDIYEKDDTTGGNVSSYNVKFGHKNYVLDVGAQNFTPKVESNYYQLIKALGLINQVQSYPVGVTIWELSDNKHLFWLPATAGGFTRYSASDWERLAQFAKFVYSAYKLNTKTPINWDMTVDKWLDSLWLTSDFKKNVLRNFLYMFLDRPKDQIGKASAVYATTYFIRTLAGAPENGGTSEQTSEAPGMNVKIPLIKVSESLIGLKGILDKALKESNANIHLSSPVSAVQPQQSGVDLVVNGNVIHADYAVLAVNPYVASTLLKDSKNTPVALKQLFADLATFYDYQGIQIFIQTQKACWMPTDKSYWEFSNIIVDTPKNKMLFSVNFGPVRPPYNGNKPIPAFKSWGNPNIKQGVCPSTVLTRQHSIPIPVPAYIRKRDEIKQWQGKNNLFFAGSWTNWYDSQESALLSAKTVVAKLQGSDLQTNGEQPSARLTRETRQAFVQNTRAWLSMIITQASQFPEIQKDMTETLNKIKALAQNNR